MQAVHLSGSGEVVADMFGLDEVPDLCPRYNIAPGQLGAVVRGPADRHGRELVLLLGVDSGLGTARPPGADTASPVVRPGPT